MTRLKQLRLEKGIEFQRQLVKELEKFYGGCVCSLGTINKIENKEGYEPKFKTLRYLSYFFDVSIAYLMGSTMDRHGKSNTKIQKYTKDDRLIDLIHRQLILERYELHHFLHMVHGLIEVTFQTDLILEIWIL